MKDEKKNALLSKIDRLDSKFENGEIEEEKYYRKREKYKEMVIDLMKGRGTEESIREAKPELARKKEELKEKIKKLDERLEKEEIAEEDYNILKKSYKEKLEELKNR
ncbi:hypothetical protein C9439_03410 [archaeon SCG-AAA382B04]|nr:hypothetical protein C9439_03410 [archaeon SCG-AAA382B04]